MITRIGLACLLLAVVLSPVRTAREAKPAITDLAAVRDGNRVRVSYRLVDCLEPETLERIASGIPIRFKHKVELVERRPGLFQGDRVHSRTLLETAVQYDSLTERYQLSRLTEPKTRRVQADAEPVVERLSSDSMEEMRAWLTVVDDAPLLAPDDAADVDYHLRVEVAIGRKWFLLVFPSSHTIHSESPTAFGD
ncbi:MAG TPA: DUF4390 domain-containing protein [Candidatus Polarisedimenticolaceae bacterium]|nr:DUF4390 domain-containing protein [Candidatus Polarisedimenticolaceae bacterium]